MSQTRPIHTPALRLVRAQDLPEPARAARRDVARENHEAALAADDARAAFAIEVARAIEGGRAAILRPEVRRSLVEAAQGRGLRPFDANLIIAVVQDAVRREAPVSSIDRTLRVIPRPGGANVGSWALWAFAAATGLAIFAGLVALVSAG
ncbi:MAG: hypothetical protein DYG92_05565 [Leptolyngbya sp. PLA1]|nr:hypothetical protein [Leptolyngbya sp. PLA1]